MNKLVKISVLFCLACLSSLAAYKGTNFIGEKYFFDKLFYRKSATYGYTDYFDLLSLDQKNSRVIEDRVKDLKNLVALAKQEKSQILGVQDAGVYRIAVIGDSLVYGTGVKQNERFPEVLERKLNKIRPTKVFALAHPADGILDNYAKFLLAKQYYNINLYIIGMFQNDLIFSVYPNYRYPDIEQVYESIKPLCPKKEFSYIMPNRNVSWEEKVIKENYPSFLDQYSNVCFLEEIIKRIASNNVIFFNFDPIPDPTKIPEDAPEHWKKSAHIIIKFDSIVRKNGGNVVHCNSINNYVYESVSKLEGHPSKKTHQLYAQSLFKEITEKSKYGFMKDSSK